MNLSDPVRQSGAPCGFVDVFDFPLNPPDAVRASGGSDFGRFRNRYEGYHTGEDWRVGTSSFGQPVYSIGHGQVVYAQPNGWGADKGALIVQHTFRGGRRILSFYGHLDPPSVELRAGDCAARGDQVGDIGDPRSPPHLHFEIRLNLPDTPGPGYWSIDPVRAGWRPPSASIWIERMAAQPGVHWTSLNTDTELQLLGQFEGNVLASSSDGGIMTLDLDQGRVRWTRALPENTSDVLVDVERDRIYVADSRGVIEAWVLTELRNLDPPLLPEPIWSIELNTLGPFTLVPLPIGGFVALSRSEMAGISDTGRVLWRESPATAVSGWAQTRDGLILLTRDEVWTADRSGAELWSDAIAGKRIVASDHPFVYTGDGVYSLDPESQTIERIFNLPEGFPRSGGLTELPGGGVLVVHLDMDDKRMLAIESDGTLRWERSISELGSRAVEFVESRGWVYMLAQIDLGRSSGYDLFSIDLERGDLLRIFSGGTRAPFSDLPQVESFGDVLLLRIPGVGLVAVDPEAALEAILGE